MTVSVCLPLPYDEMNWDYILTSFPPDNLYVIGDEEDAPTTNVFAALKAIYIRDASELPPEPVLVLMAADNGRYVAGDTNLVGFEHPEHVIYLFGHDTHWLDDTILGGKVPDHKVFIPTATTDDLWSWQAAAITFWDRKMKRG